MMALPKHPTVIPIQLGQPEFQRAGGPGVGNANERECILIRYKKNSEVFFLLINLQD